MALFIVFRPFWLSHFDMILSDPVDGRFTIAILEHWYRVFYSASGSSLNFFFPQPGVLGFSDADFLLAIPYAVLRRLGTDRYLAFEFTMIFLTTVGFAGMLYLLRLFGFKSHAALVGAVLFVISNIYYIQIVHPQLISVVFVPLLVVLGFKYWQHRTERPLARAYLVGLGILLALLFFTCFYVAWFAVVTCASVALWYLVLNATIARSTEPLREVAGFIWAQRLGLLLFTLAFSVAMIPFFVVYLPALRQVGPRTLTATLYYMPSALGLIDVGAKNLLWGRASAVVERVMAPKGLHEHPSGWPYLTLAVFTTTALYCLAPRSTASQLPKRAETHRFRAISALSLTWLVWSLAGIKVGSHATLWELTRVIPGAAVIRVPSRMNLVLNIALIIVIIYGWELLLRATAARYPRLYALGLLLPILVCLEQLNAMPTHLISRTGEARKFSRIHPPPQKCSAFYVSNWSETKPGMRAFQTDAMLVAEELQIPTLNGYSGWFPTGWNLLDGSKEQVVENARNWAVQHGVSRGLCALDINSGTWSPAGLQKP